MDAKLKKLSDLDRKLVDTAKSIKILRNLSWPAEACKNFLTDLAKGNPKLPNVPVPELDYRKEREVLTDIMAKCDRKHPVADYIYKTAQSYLAAAHMLESCGTSAFTELSIGIYGGPDDVIGSTDVTNLNAAEYFTQAADDVLSSGWIPKAEFCIMPIYVVEEMQRRIDQVFKQHKVEVVIDPALSSKAAAGATKIRIRGFTPFSRADVGQLIEHEAFVHTLSMLNGREQPYLKSLGLGAPRTTRTQEGIALFAELITTSIDIERLRRIAQRVKAIKMGIDGADFIQVFRYFRDNSQSEVEAFQSAARIFRGGDPRGGIVFTKDAVYLQGMLLLTTFLRKSFHEGKPDYTDYLCAGRLTLGDIIQLEPFFETGFIAKPIYEPEWIKNKAGLAAFMSYSLYINRMNLGTIELNDFANNERLSD